MGGRQSRSITFTIPGLLIVWGLSACAVDDQPDGAAAADTAMDASAQPTAPAAADTQTISVTDVGLATPESVVHDEQADVYLVSNINGQPLDRDDNGFIARVRPDGTVEQLRWIDGAASDGFTLNAPKGLALKGDTLFVSDIDSVRAFHRTSGEPLGAYGVPGASFLNDLAVGSDGTLYVSDSGLAPDFSSSGTDAVHRFEGGRSVVVAEGERLAGPNGLALDGDDLLVAPFASNEVLRVPPGGDSISTAATLPGGQLDGIVRLGDGSLLVSSWESQAVYRVPATGGTATVVVEGIPSPADIGYDARRQRVLIPVFTEDRVEFRPVR